MAVIKLVDLDLKGKRVFIRADLNVPVKEGKVTEVRVGQLELARRALADERRRRDDERCSMILPLEHEHAVRRGGGGRGSGVGGTLGGLVEVDWHGSLSVRRLVPLGG